MNKYTRKYVCAHARKRSRRKYAREYVRMHACEYSCKYAHKYAHKYERSPECARELARTYITMNDSRTRPEGVSHLTQRDAKPSSKNWTQISCCVTPRLLLHEMSTSLVLFRYLLKLCSLLITICFHSPSGWSEREHCSFSWNVSGISRR